MILVLKAAAGELAGRQFAFAAPNYCLLGRSRQCNLYLPGDETVSRSHCLIELGADEVWVQDLGSLNGTLINGVKIGQRLEQKGDRTLLQAPRQTLHDGDEVRVCVHVFTVRVFDAACQVARHARLPRSDEMLV